MWWLWVSVSGMSEPTPQPGVQMFELRVSAAGEVRDADGNLVSSEPVELTAMVTAEQAAEFLRTEGGL